FSCSRAIFATRYGNFRSVRHWKLAGTFSVCTVERFPVDLRLQFNPFPPFRPQKLFQKIQKLVSGVVFLVNIWPGF
ncbi:hypothetical protein GBAR_LOCUS5901, partial [Geodia barretti]